MSYKPLPDALVEILKNNEVIASKHTDSKGKAVFWLKRDTYILHTKKEGYNPYEAQITIDKDTTVSVILTKIQDYISPLTPSNNYCTKYYSWYKVYTFTKTNELNEVCNEENRYAYISDSALQFNTPEGEIGRCVYKFPYSWLPCVIAVAFKVDITKIKLGTTVARILAPISSDRNHIYEVNVRGSGIEDYPLKVVIKSGETLIFAKDAGWIILAILIDNGEYCWQSENNGNGSGDFMSWTEEGSYIKIILNEYNNYDDNQYKLKVDWIGIGSQLPP